MTTFEQALRERLKKLDADHAKHRGALVAALACETGKEPDAPMRLEVPPLPMNMLPADARNQTEVVKAAIDAIVREGDGTFTKDSVREALKSSDPNVSENVIKNMASFLWHLHKHEGYIAIKEKGQGHRQSVYVKVQT